MIVWAVLALVVVGAILFVTVSRKASPLYLDKGRNSRVFRNEEYHISAKPDRLVKVENRKVDLYEYKSRTTRVYESDVVEATAAAIAVSSVYEVRNIIIELGNGKSKTIAARSADEMFRFISKHFGHAQAIERGETVPAYPATGKCRSCGVRRACNYQF